MITRGVGDAADSRGDVGVLSVRPSRLASGQASAVRRFDGEVTPMMRIGTSEEVARAALFLAVDATFTTRPSCPSTAVSRSCRAP